MAVLFQGQLNIGDKCLDHQGNQWAVPILATPNGSPSQHWVLYDDADSNLLVADSLGWMALRTDNLLISPAWKDPSSPQHWFLRPDGQLQAEQGPLVLRPTADGASVMTTVFAMGWTFTDPNQPVSPLIAMPVAMFAPQNPSATDPFKETGSWEYWGTLLGKSAPVITMPLAVGLTSNWSGDIYAWQDPGSIMVQDTNPTWMLSIGLTYPSGPNLTAAAAYGLPIFDAGAPMDVNWSAAVAEARFGSAWLATGGDAAHITQLRSKLIIRPGWEMTGDWYLWGRGYPGQVATWNADFAACYQRMVTIARLIGNLVDQNGHTCEIISAFNPNGDYSYPQGINLDNFYPGDAYVDMIAVDCYDFPQFMGGYQPDGITPNLSPADRFNNYTLLNLQAADAYAHAHGKSVGLCEWAAGGAANPDPLVRDNPTFINGVATWALAAASPIGVLGYWSGSDASGYDGDIEIYPQQKAAFIANHGA